MEEIRGKINWSEFGNAPNLPLTTQSPMNVFKSNSTTIDSACQRRNLPKVTEPVSQSAKIHDEVVGRMISKLPYDQRDLVYGVVNHMFNTIEELEETMNLSRRSSHQERRNRVKLERENSQLVNENEALKLNFNNLSELHKETKRGAREAYRKVVQQKAEIERLNSYHEPLVELISSFNHSSQSSSHHLLPPSPHSPHPNLGSSSSSQYNPPRTSDTNSRPVTTDRRCKKPISELSAISFASSQLHPLHGDLPPSYDQPLDTPLDSVLRGERVRSEMEWTARQNILMKHALR